MEQQVITSEQIIAYNAWLLNEEKGPGTVEKYQRDVGALAAWLNGEAVTKGWLRSRSTPCWQLSIASSDLLAGRTAGLNS